MKRNLSEEEKKHIDSLIRHSVEFAFQNPTASKEYIAHHAQEMDPSVQQQHIDLYVNDFSVTLGVDGKNAIQTLFDEGKKSGLLPDVVQPLFV